MIKALFILFPLFLYSQCTYNMDINFDLKNNSLTSIVNIKDSSKSLEFYSVNFDFKDKNEILKKINNGSNNLSFEYKIKLKEINREFIYLLNAWYPQIKSLCSYNIKTNLGLNYKIVKERTNKEIEKATFIASTKYIVSSKNYNNIKISTYFFKNDKKQADKYINKTIEYIKMYEDLFGVFPYKNFSVVENYAITGYSMPSYTLVGSYLLNKDYLINRSLGHEVLHQYFGNSIFNNNSKGNYSEGLVTHLADNYYEKLKNKDISNRKLDILSFMNFVSNDYPARDFIYRDNRNSMSIGYTKIAFVFYMLENKIGNNEFIRILKKLYKEKKFTEVNLLQLKEYFIKNSKTDLREFFTQWFDKKGIIDFKISNVQRIYDYNGFKLSFTLTQKEKYVFTLPIFIKTYDKDVFKTVEINKKVQDISIYLKEEPLSFVLDKEYTLFRKLFKSEYPLNIGQLLNTKNLIIVKDEKTFKKYENISRAFPNAKIINYQDLKFEDLKKSSVIFLDKTNESLKHFFPRLKNKKEDSFLSLKKHTYNNGEVLAVLHVPKKLNRSFYMLKHYASYKDITIVNKKVTKEVDKKEMGYKYIFTPAAIISLVQEATKLNTIINEIKDAKIIYVGESHTNMTHHLNQLRVIKALHKDGKKVAIGMEMFQTAFQKDINEYLSGKTSENEFLKNTQYFKRWKFDYTYYKTIIDYAKKNNLPIIALNTPRKTIKEVAKKGILAYKDKNELPLKIDQSDYTYKNNLMSIYSQHDFKAPSENKKDEELDEKKLQKKIDEEKLKKDFFFQSQLIWDEIMAENIVKFINKNPEYTFVVVAGAGHIEKHRGIPIRVFQDTNLAYKVILNDVKSGLVNDIIISNYSEIKIKKAIKLGVYLHSDKNLKVTKLVPHSYSENFAMKKDDLILEFNNEKVNDLFDLKRLLYFVKEIKKVTLKIKRENKIVILFYDKKEKNE